MDYGTLGNISAPVSPSLNYESTRQNCFLFSEQVWLSGMIKVSICCFGFRYGAMFIRVFSYLPDPVGDEHLYVQDEHYVYAAQ